MDIFSKKFNNLQNILNYDINESYSNFTGESRIFGKSEGSLSKRDNDKLVAKADISEMEHFYGRHKFSVLEPRIGAHPDFKDKIGDSILNHYAVSMFVDIKGSTSLSRRYNLFQIRQIKDTILTLVIEVCSFFGGHIQRLQGDGVFVYFVRSEMNPKDAVINSLNASSLLAFLMQFKMPKYFEKEDIKPPRIRIGIDYGDDKQTIWSYYGVPYCNELTTTGLHTDLAAKMQAKASSNGINIGENIIKELDLQDTIVKQDAENPNIFDNYKMYNFKWDNYLSSFDFIKRDGERRLHYHNPVYRLKCEIAQKDSQNFFPYSQNLYSIPKGYKIKFTLLKNNNPYFLNRTLIKSLKWKIINTGKEASNGKDPNEDMDRLNDKTSCIVNAEYLGNHSMQCKIVRPKMDTNINIKFPLFVQ